MRDYYDKEIKPELSEEGNEVIDVFIKAYKEGMKSNFQTISGSPKTDGKQY